MYLVEIIYGSRLFGTAVADSDIDKKRVYLSDMHDLVFGQTNTHNTVTGEGRDKVEVEEHHITSFARMVKQGQTLALSLMFCPENFRTHTTPEWDELVTNRHRLVSSNLKPFVGYARSQAIRYSLKGERVQTLEDFIETLRLIERPGRLFGLDEAGRLFPEVFNGLQLKYQNREGVRLWTEDTASGHIRHIEVCGKSFGETTPLKLWIPPCEAMLKRYGHRAMAAKEADGSDLKAMYHAIRLACEMNELLRTGHITYPRPEASLLLDIRQGKLTNGEVAALIEQAVAEGDRLFEGTALPARIDETWLDDWTVRTQANYATRQWLDEPVT